MEKCYGWMDGPMNRNNYVLKCPISILKFIEIVPFLQTLVEEHVILKWLVKHLVYVSNTHITTSE